jgi:hypothetical protein
MRLIIALAIVVICQDNGFCQKLTISPGIITAFNLLKVKDGNPQLRHFTQNAGVSLAVTYKIYKGLRLGLAGNKVWITHSFKTSGYPRPMNNFIGYEQWELLFFLQYDVIKTKRSTITLGVGDGFYDLYNIDVRATNNSNQLIFKLPLDYDGPGGFLNSSKNDSKNIIHFFISTTLLTDKSVDYTIKASTAIPTYSQRYYTGLDFTLKEAYFRLEFLINLKFL